MAFPLPPLHVPSPSPTTAFPTRDDPGLRRGPRVPRRPSDEKICLGGGSYHGTMEISPVEDEQELSPGQKSPSLTVRIKRRGNSSSEPVR